MFLRLALFALSRLTRSIYMFSLALSSSIPFTLSWWGAKRKISEHRKFADVARQKGVPRLGSTHNRYVHKSHNQLASWPLNQYSIQSSNLHQYLLDCIRRERQEHTGRQQQKENIKKRASKTCMENLGK
ncbi:hypothetical protein F4778DRAFT_758728 [Xylariomycetidae sp. FL2044]|nr:hypothetical protein F4778DRAFT_758728 [Xylariomycetidae sp. FL2044]